MNDTNPHAGRGGGGRQRRRGGRRGRGGRGGRGGGQEGRRGNKPTLSKKEEGGADTALSMKQADVVVMEKFHNENRSPQDPKPPASNETFAKNVDELKKVLGVGVDNATSTSSNNTGDTKNAAGARGATCGTVGGDVQSEKEKMQQKLKKVSS